MRPIRQNKKRRTALLALMSRFPLRLLKNVCIYLTIEFAAYIAIGAVAIALISLGLSNNVALTVSIVLVVLSLVGSFLAYRQHRIITNRPARNFYSRVQGDVKFADWIARLLSTKAPQEWEEYQDWLHDILLARRQLLDRDAPHWKVTLVTYWRLVGFCVTVTSIKLKRMAIAARRRL